MIRIENTKSYGWEEAIRGMRNPLNSWDRSDSDWVILELPEGFLDGIDRQIRYDVGPNDRDLMIRLRKAGTDHRKFMRMITVYADITAPLYWWKEFDTYKVGTVANSCSTMHTIHKRPFTEDDFSLDMFFKDGFGTASKEAIDSIITVLNYYRDIYLNGKDLFGDGTMVLEPKNEQAWYTMIQLLPSSYNQKRTVMMNYEVLANIYKSRKDHKLNEWHKFCEWASRLPYGEFITGELQSGISMRLQK